MTTISLDFETYSEAGYRLENGKRVGSGIEDVGTMSYAAHPTTDILCMAWSIYGEVKLWTPQDYFPEELRAHIERGATLAAWNAFFERVIWHFVGVKKHGFPAVLPSQWRCTMARARAYALPGALGKAAVVLGDTPQKDKGGEKLIKTLCIPAVSQNRLGLIKPEDKDALNRLYEYCRQDVITETAIARQLPELPLTELDFWRADQEINWRGVQIDALAVNAIISLVKEAEEDQSIELDKLTEGSVKSQYEIKNLRVFLSKNGADLPDLNKKTVSDALGKNDLPAPVRRALEIRKGGSLISLKKSRVINNMLYGERIHNLFTYHGARTGRATANKAQPQNLPSGGSVVHKCPACDQITKYSYCPICFSSDLLTPKWSPEISERILNDVVKTTNLKILNYYYGDIIPLLPGCLRSLFTAAPGKSLIGADYSAIEAVVLAVLSGETWRIEVFKTHGLIYEESASRITGVPFCDFLEHKSKTGEHHPLRNKIGKTAELASGYQGWVGSWKSFGAGEHLTDAEIEQAVRAWRQANPAIVSFWRGLEQCARLAILYPGTTHQYRLIQYQVIDDKLFCTLPSGRRLTYWRPKIEEDKIIYEGWNTDPKNGARGWGEMQIYGGKLTENVVQAVARDLLAHAITSLEANGYPVVLHVHDEIVCEVEPHADPEKFKSLMGALPGWAKGYPLRVGEVWRGNRYRK